MLCFSCQDSTGAAEEQNDQDVVLIKEETAKEEVKDDDTTDELLLNEDGERRKCTDCNVNNTGTNAESSHKSGYKIKSQMITK